MELQSALENRKSIRSYLSKDVEPEKLTALIEAASLAPSWKNSQTARYYVIHTPEKLEQFMKEEAPKQLEMVQNLYKTYGVRVSERNRMQTKFIASNEPSVADAHAYTTLKMIEGHDATILDRFPELKAWKAVMNEQEGVKKYNA